ncbi:MAG: SpoIIE family protein phosphatase [Acidobacteriaceae bacterium]|nr:SpoIIE family protein phosphatase [Acidobacteriaceae bacterium]MBV9779293.1 SpoIIE family protein phosphatase [Acidobacteriaceae bacterium]
MMPRILERLRQAKQVLGTVGITFFITFALALIFYFTGQGGLLFIDLLFLIPFAIILLFRGFRYANRNPLWSLRNRLLFVYGLFGVLPVILLFVLFGLATWAVMSELAIYLASSALDRRLDSVHNAVETLRKLAPTERRTAAREITQLYSAALPHMAVYIKDPAGDYRCPPDAPDLQVPPGWQDTNGLLFRNGLFYGWAHVIDHQEEITITTPLSQEIVENLVPHLGVIALVESEDEGHRRIKSGDVRISARDNPDNFNFNFEPSASPDAQGHSRFPPSMGRFDVPVFFASTRPHVHLEKAGTTHPGALVVGSRPSAVWRSFFSSSEVLRGILFDVVVAVAILFLCVELVALLIGVSFSRRITRAVNQLYEGTRRVIHGDFSHRIPIRTHDQLGELAESFNQMTGNLQRLLSVEKEKERLQTELEIAREVQTQLYPKEAPPSSVLRLTVRCDPARMVSGDYYDYEEIANGKVAFAIGDVAGKGISAALLMATLQATLRAQLSQYQPVRENECTSVPELDTANLVSQLNQQLCAHTSPEKYATFFFALFDEKARSLTYTNAGHLSPLLFRNGSVVPLDSNGTVVGAFPFSKYEESCLTVEPQDLLVCYTDGITEPENAYGEMFGEERLIELVRKHAHEDDHQIIRTVLEAVRSWTGSPELHDDMTLLLARQVAVS